MYEKLNLKQEDGVMQRYQLKSYQELFDYLIVSGIVFLDSKIVKYVDENVEPFIKKFKQSQLARFGKCEPPEYEDVHIINFYFYQNDFEAFSKYLIEKNYKSQWVFEILLKAFLDNVPEVVEIVKRGQKAQVRQRKKIVARLVNDEWIEILQIDEARTILSQLTDKYENRQFGANLQKDIDNLYAEINKEKTEEEELNNALNEKLRSLRISRSKELQSFVKPRIDTSPNGDT